MKNPTVAVIDMIIQKTPARFRNNSTHLHSKNILVYLASGSALSSGEAEFGYLWPSRNLCLWRETGTAGSWVGMGSICDCCDRGKSNRHPHLPGCTCQNPGHYRCLCARNVRRRWNCGGRRRLSWRHNPDEDLKDSHGGHNYFSIVWFSIPAILF